MHDDIALRTLDPAVMFSREFIAATLLTMISAGSAPMREQCRAPLSNRASPRMIRCSR